MTVCVLSPLTSLILTAVSVWHPDGQHRQGQRCGFGRWHRDRSQSSAVQCHPESYISRSYTTGKSFFSLITQGVDVIELIVLHVDVQRSYTTCTM